MILTRLRGSVRTSNPFRGSRMAAFFCLFWGCCFFFKSLLYSCVYVSCVCVPTERNRKAKADHPGIMKPPRSVQQQASPSARSANRAGQRSTAVGRRGGRVGVAVKADGIRQTTSNTILQQLPSEIILLHLCKIFILHIHIFFLGNVINSRCRCLFFFYYYYFANTTPQT